MSMEFGNIQLVEHAPLDDVDEEDFREDLESRIRSIRALARYTFRLINDSEAEYFASDWAVYTRGVKELEEGQLVSIDFVNVDGFVSSSIDFRFNAEDIYVEDNTGATRDKEFPEGPLVSGYFITDDDSFNSAFDDLLKTSKPKVLTPA